MPPNKSILIIEDDTFIAKMYEKKLRLAQFDVQTALDGEVGIAVAKQTQPQLILLDIMLPKLDGWEVLAMLKADTATRNIPVILLTNIGGSEDIERGLALGAADYLIKAQFVPSEVVQRIQSLITP